MCVCFKTQYEFHSEKNIILLGPLLSTCACPYRACCLSRCNVSWPVSVKRRGQERDSRLYKSPEINHVTMKEEEGWVPPGPAQHAAC